MPTALITGVMGQDGSYLAEHLLELGYKVYGLVRREPRTNEAIDGCIGWAANHNRHIEFIYGDMRDELSLRTAVVKSWPDEIYNLAGQVFVPTSWEQPAETFDVNTAGLLRILKIIEKVKRDTKIYQASSSEMFGNHRGKMNVETPMWPTSPYGVSKLSAHRLCALYRERGLYVVSGILFNHESPRRGQEMVTRKIAMRVAAWANGDTTVMGLGNIDSRRDWGYAGEYVVAMHKMLQHYEPDDYVVGTGVSHSVSDFLFACAREVGLTEDFVRSHFKIDDRLTRSQEIFDMTADNSKIRTALNWEPHVSFNSLVMNMMAAEMYRTERKGKMAVSA